MLRIKHFNLQTFGWQLILRPDSPFLCAIIPLQLNALPTRFKVGLPINLGFSCGLISITSFPDDSSNDIGLLSAWLYCFSGHWSTWDLVVIEANGANCLSPMTFVELADLGTGKRKFSSRNEAFLIGVVTLSPIFNSSSVMLVTHAPRPANGKPF